MDEVHVANIALSYMNQQPITLKAGETWETFRPTNPEHTAARTHFDSARRQALSERAWRFATIKDTLQPSTYRPVEARWNLSYVWPADCLRFVRIVDLYAGVGERPRIYPDSRSRETVTLEEVEQDGGLARPQAEALISPTGLGLNEIAAEALGWLRRWETRVYRDGDTLRRVILTNLPGGVGEYVVDVPDVGLWSAQFQTAFEWLLASKIGYAVKGKAADAARAYAFFIKTVSSAAAQDANESNDKPREEASWITRRRRR